MADFSLNTSQLFQLLLRVIGDIFQQNISLTCVQNYFTVSVCSVRSYVSCINVPTFQCITCALIWCLRFRRVSTLTCAYSFECCLLARPLFRVRTNSWITLLYTPSIFTFLAVLMIWLPRWLFLFAVEKLKPLRFSGVSIHLQNVRIASNVMFST